MLYPLSYEGVRRETDGPAQSRSPERADLSCQDARPTRERGPT
jgi:hypothetical protein